MNMYWRYRNGANLLFMNDKQTFIAVIRTFHINGEPDAFTVLSGDQHTDFPDIKSAKSYAEAIAPSVTPP